MKLNSTNAELYSPGGTEISAACSGITDLCIAAHHDDIEIMAYHAIISCYNSPEQSFGGVVVTDGASSPRSGPYANYTNEQMKAERVKEQKAAADLGKYGLQVLLGYPKQHVMDGTEDVVNDLRLLIETCRPQRIYIHNFADKHDTHVAVAMGCVAALRSLPAELRPKQVLCMEVWRGLDWLDDREKLLLDTSGNPQLAGDLVRVFASQVAGGKQYDQAVLGRRKANATFSASHSVDQFDSVAYGMDVTDIVLNPAGDLIGFMEEKLDQFREDVVTRMKKTGYEA